MQDDSAHDNWTGFDRYRLLRRLDGGGRFEFYLASDRHGDGTARCVVLRALENRHTPLIWPAWADPSVARLLEHPNIVQMLSDGWSGDYRYFVFEYVEGCDLRGPLNEGLLPRAKALTVAYQIAKALDFAHRLKDSGGQPLNFVHGALSARNVLISAQGIVKLAGFGFHKMKPERSTAISVDLLLELAPEQIRGLEADTRTDLFHLGLLLFRMLYGKCYVSSALRPFRHLPAFGALPAPTELSFLADHSLSLVLAGLLAESNSARFESARTLMDALSAAQEHPPAHV